MFDSPVHDACPGEITACGWPWHGRLDYTVGAASPVLTLPNGVTATLKWFPNVVAAYDWHQHGTLLRFRDPCAIDVERTPEQLAADAERGIEWRADVLYGPREGLVYGIGPKTRQPRSWLYHQGNMNWRVTVFAAGQIRLAQLLIVIGRKRRPDVRHNVVVSRPAGAPAMTDLVVIDALRDGSRVLLARYRAADIPWSSPGSVFVQAELGAWCGMPYDLWELRLGYDEATQAHTAELVSVLDAATVAGEYVESPVEAIVPRVSFASSITGMTSDAQFEYVTAETTWSVTDETVLNTSLTDARQASSTSSGHRVIGAYYDSEGAIGYWSVVYGGETALVGDPQIDFSGSQEWGAQRPISATFGPWGTNVITVTTANTLAGHNSAFIELRRGDVVVSRAEVREDVTQSGVGVQSYHSSLNYEDGNWTISSRSELEPGVLATQTRVQECSVDEYVVVPPGSPSVHPGWGSTPPLAMRNAGARFFTLPAADRLTFSAFRYCAQLPVLAVTVRGTDTDDLRQVLGRAASPDGLVHAGGHERGAPFAGLYGSWNPVTGEVLRDTPNPVSYL